MNETRIAIVTPWFGANLRGGAEQQSWQLAHQLSAHGYPVDVLTTCSAGFADDWGRNSRPPGVSRAGAITVRRFRVGKRDRRAFERVNAILMAVHPSDLRRSVSPIGDEDANAYYENNINSPALCDHLRAHGAEYSHVIFIPYLYGTTLAGLPLVADRAYLQPCLHDESYAYLPRVAEVAHLAKGLLFNSDGEARLAARLFGPGVLHKSHVVGEGVSLPSELPPMATRVGSFVPSQERYVLYLGRQDPAKNISTLIQAFVEFRRRKPTSRLKLVLAGESAASYGDASRSILDLGTVAEAEKAALLAGARALVQPSINESFSRVIYEAWMHGRPVAVHRDCVPTENAVRESHGGFLANSVATFEIVLSKIEETADAELDAIGERGRAYAFAVSAWNHVIHRYERALGLTLEPDARRHRLWQIVPADSGELRHYADALARSLRRRATDVIDATPETAAPPHGIATLVHAGPKDALGPFGWPASLVVHDFGTSGAFGNGRAEALKISAREGTIGFASTPLGLQRLRDAGFADPRLLPVCIDTRKWDALPDLPLATALQDGMQNLVYVGNFDDIEHLNRLLVTFLHYLTIERDARLTVVAIDGANEDVYATFFKEVQRLDLIDRVLVARHLTPAQLQSVYRSADLFISLDRGEGHLGEHYLEAMWFDVPILAYATELARWLVGPSGILVTSDDDLVAVAALAHSIVNDPALRKQIVEGGRRTRERFNDDEISRRLAALLAAGETSAASS